MDYNLTLKTAPTTEPLTLAEVKERLKISDYADTSAGLTIEESILIATRTPGTVNGTSVLVTGYTAVVELNVGTLLATASLAVKIQESNDNATWVDWYTFTTVTPDTDNAVFKETYTGDNAYIRVVAVLANANGDYAANIILNQGYTAEDTVLASQITAARQFCEARQSKAYITQVWEMALPYFPGEIEIPIDPLQTVDSIVYTDSDGTATTLTADTEYVYSKRGLVGRIVPAYGMTWPSFVPFPLDAVIVTFTCGYGAATAVPENIKAAMLLHIKIMRESYGPEDLKYAIAARDNLLSQNARVKV